MVRLENPSGAKSTGTTGKRVPAHVCFRSAPNQNKFVDQILEEFDKVSCDKKMDSVGKKAGHFEFYDGS